MRKRIALLVMALMMALSMSFGGVAFAKITLVCENPGGQEPQGQCQGEALTETAVNPAGHAPPGQQP